MSVTERIRSHRALRRRGLRVLPLEVRDTEVEALIRRGLLNPTLRHDFWEIGGAVGNLLDRVLKPPHRV